MPPSEPQQLHTPATAGLKLIIAYKVIKAPVLLVLAAWLTLAPAKAYQTIEWLAEELSSASSFWSAIGEWLSNHLSLRAVRGGAVLLWLDGLFTTAEAVLLILRKPWSEWMVAIGLGALLPFELVSVIRKPGVGKVAVLAVNAAVVIYLVWRRITQRQQPRSSEETKVETASVSRRARLD